MKFSIFGLCASVDIRPLPGAWVAELLGVVLWVQDRYKVNHFPLPKYKHVTLKGLNENLQYFPGCKFKEFAIVRLRSII